MHIIKIIFMEKNTYINMMKKIILFKYYYIYIIFIKNIIYYFKLYFITKGIE